MKSVRHSRISKSSLRATVCTILNDAPIAVLLFLLFFSFIASTVAGAQQSSVAVSSFGSIVLGGTPVWSNNIDSITDFTTLGMRYSFDTPSYYGSNPHGDTANYADIVTSLAHDGSKSIRLTAGGTGQSNSRIELDMYPSTLITNDFYFSWWAYLPSNLVPTGSNWLAIFQLEGSVTSSYLPIAKLHINTDGTTRLRWQDLNATQTWLASGPAVPRDQWVHFEWYTNISANGRITTWMNGVKMWDVSGVDTSGLNQSTLYFMLMIYGMPGVMYVDDLALYNSNQNGTVDSGAG